MLNLAKKDGDLKFNRGRRMAIKYNGTVFDLLHHRSNSSKSPSLAKKIIRVLFSPGTPSPGQITEKKWGKKEMDSDLVPGKHKQKMKSGVQAQNYLYCASK